MREIKINDKDQYISSLLVSENQTAAFRQFAEELPCLNQYFRRGVADEMLVRLHGCAKFV